jgi:hypothetical protein
MVSFEFSGMQTQQTSAALYGGLPCDPWWPWVTV